VAVAVPVLAQSSLPLDRRVEKLEKELRAVQRKVFPSGAGITVEPEIGPPPANAQPLGVPASSALNDINARVDSLESQLRSLTAQVEEANHRAVQADQALANFRTAMEGRLAALEQAGPAPSPAASTSATTASEPGSSASDPGEMAYLEGFRLWNSGKFAEAQATLEAMIKKYPKHPRASFAQNLLGRAYLDGGKPATAAKVLLANYEGNRNGDRAQDSLYYLGVALTQLNRPADACKAFDELEDVFKGKIRAAIRQDLPKARTAAKCR
jgi:TolA-binding protein